MKKPLGCLSPLGVLVALAITLIFAGTMWLEGNTLFSPGSLSAAHRSDSSPGGFSSHADFETQCDRCHSPWQGADPERCLDCHVDAQEQIARQQGIHGRLHDPQACTHCHDEHRGREADISVAARADYPHHQVGFSLARHRSPAGDGGLLCADCHESDTYQFDRGRCESCHSDLNAGFVALHTGQYGRECRTCHDGSGAMADLDHDLLFPLTDGHGGVECRACHLEGEYRGRSADCEACHDEPDLHRSQFGTHCGACHSAVAWAPAQLQQHSFPLDHGMEGEAACQECHPQNFVAYSCSGCHEHDPEEIGREHREAGITILESCAGCHPAGQVDYEKRVVPDAG